MKCKQYIYGVLIVSTQLLATEIFAQTTPCTNSAPGTCNGFSEPLIKNDSVIQSCDEIRVSGEGLEPPVLKYKEIISGFPTGNAWYKQTASGWVSAGNGQNLYSNDAPTTKDALVGNYMLCVTSGSCIYSRNFRVEYKSLKKQLHEDREIDTLNTAAIFKCNEDTIRIFPDGGNTTKYKYKWTQEESFVNNDENLKNGRYSGPDLRGKDITRTFTATPYLQIEENATGCIYPHLVQVQIMKRLYPEIYTTTETFCQGAPKDVEVRVLVDGLKDLNAPIAKVSIATMSVGASQAITFNELKATPSDSLLGNTLGRNNNELKIRGIIAQVFKFNITPTISGDVRFKFDMKTEKGCKASVEKTINVTQTTPYTISWPGASSAFCEDVEKVGPLTAQNSPAGTFSSSTTPAAVAQESGSYYFYPKIAGVGTHTINFTVTPTTPDACAGGGSQDVTVKAKPKPSLIGRQNVCPGSSNIVYEDESTIPSTATRTPRVEDKNGNPTSLVTITPDPILSNRFSLNFSTPFIPTPLDETVLLVAINDDGGCEDRDTLPIRVSFNNIAPEPLGEDTGCATTPSFNYSTNFPNSVGFTRSWFVNNVSRTFNADGSIDVDWNTLTSPYTIRYEDTEDANPNCKITSDTLTFTQYTLPAPIITPNPLGAFCPGDTIRVSVQDPATGVSYTWQPAGLPSSAANTASFIAPNNITDYTINVKASVPNDVCLALNDSKKATIKPAPSNPLTSDKVQHCFDDEPTYLLNLTPEGITNGGSFDPLWIDETDITKINAVEYPVKTEGMYRVKVTDLTTNCSVFDSTLIENICGAKFFMPAAFSPNNDNKNDSLEVFGNHFESFDLKIFSRWGELIYSSKNHKEKWDGTFGGSPMPTGVYPYVVVYESLNDKNKKISTTKEGSIALIR